MDWLQLSLEVHQLPQDEVRRGWVRIHERQRGGIRSGDLLEIRGPSGSALRVVYGFQPGYRVGGNTLVQENWICLDEPTREALGLQESRSGSTATISIRRSSQPWRFFAWLCYGLSHPEIPLKVGSWIAIVSLFLGIVSIALGIIALVRK